MWHDFKQDTKIVREEFGDKSGFSRQKNKKEHMFSSKIRFNNFDLFWHLLFILHLNKNPTMLL